MFAMLCTAPAAEVYAADETVAYPSRPIRMVVPFSPGGQKFARSSGTFRVTDAISDRLLRLPLYFGITDAQVDAVIDAVKAFYSKSA